MSALIVGLTGGIGSGKSTVSDLLVERGATLIDADAVTRELQAPGQPVLAAIFEHFGPAVLAEDGTLDRQALADLVFPDPEALAELNAIVHPAVGREIAERLQAARDAGGIVILDIPLLVESGRSDTAATVVVDVEPDVAVDRLVEHRGIGREDALARQSRQASREERIARADWVVANHGDLGELAVEVDRLWAWLEELHASSAEGDSAT